MGMSNYFNETSILLTKMASREPMLEPGYMPKWSKRGKHRCQDIVGFWPAFKNEIVHFWALPGGMRRLCGGTIGRQDKDLGGQKKRNAMRGKAL